MGQRQGVKKSSLGPQRPDLPNLGRPIFGCGMPSFGRPTFFGRMRGCGGIFRFGSLGRPIFGDGSARATWATSLAAEKVWATPAPVAPAIRAPVPKPVMVAPVPRRMAYVEARSAAAEVASTGQPTTVSTVPTTEFHTRVPSGII